MFNWYCVVRSPSCKYHPLLPLILFHHFSLSLWYRIVCLLYYFYLAHDSLSYQVAVTAAVICNYTLSNTIRQPLVIDPKMWKLHNSHLRTKDTDESNHACQTQCAIFDIMVSIYVKQHLNLSHSNELQYLSRSSFILMMAAIIFTTKFIQPHF